MPTAKENLEMIKNNTALIMRHGEEIAVLKECVKVLPEMKDEIVGINKILNDGLKSSVVSLKAAVESMDKKVDRLQKQEMDENNNPIERRRAYYEPPRRQMSPLKKWVVGVSIPVTVAIFLYILSAVQEKMFHSFEMRIDKKIEQIK